LPDIEADIWFLSHESGGRRAPVASGYRPQFFYDDRDWDATHEYVGKEWVQPGERVLARLTFVSPESHVGHVNVGMPFLIREGSKTVGYGVVTAILDLEHPQQRPRGGPDSNAARAPDRPLS
jgi:elongation factor Tu